MPEPKQLRILIALTDHLAGMRVADGYAFDLDASRVHRGIATFGADEPVPFISILESLRADPKPLEAGHERLNREERWELLIQGWAKGNRDYPVDDLYRLKAAVEKRLSEVVSLDDLGNPRFPAIYRLGKLITAMRIGPGVVRAATPQPGGTEAFYLPVMLTYAINVADPYA